MTGGPLQGPSASLLYIVHLSINICHALFIFMKYIKLSATLMIFLNLICTSMYSLLYFMTSLVAQMVKHLSTMRETWSLGWEDPLEKEMATHSRTITWKIPWVEEPGGLQSIGSQRVRHDWATSIQFNLTLCFHKSNSICTLFVFFWLITLCMISSRSICAAPSLVSSVVSDSLWPHGL